jgi:cytoplasmic tRNA 2-thiolation protein 2
MVNSRPIQPGIQDWKASISIRTLSIPDATPTQQPTHGGGDSSHLSSRPSSSPPSLTPHLCYACHTTLTSRSCRGIPSIPAGTRVGADGAVALPIWVESRLLSSIRESGEVGELDQLAIDDNPAMWNCKKMDTADMKEMIFGFLLD